MIDTQKPLMLTKCQNKKYGWVFNGKKSCFCMFKKIMVDKHKNVDLMLAKMPQKKHFWLFLNGRPHRSVQKVERKIMVNFEQNKIMVFVIMLESEKATKTQKESWFTQQNSGWFGKIHGSVHKKLMVDNFLNKK